MELPENEDVGSSGPTPLAVRGVAPRGLPPTRLAVRGIARGLAANEACPTVCRGLPEMEDVRILA